MEVRVSAPGKVHLIGEHAVVYGKPAILAAVGLRCHVSAKAADSVCINLKDSGTKAEFGIEEAMDFAAEARSVWNDGRQRNDFSALFAIMKKDNISPLKAMVGTVMSELKPEAGVSLGISSEIPVGSGMGSSASLAVSLTRAIAEMNGVRLSRERNNEIAFRLEQLLHGSPSGGDNTACCYGNAIWFIKGSPSAVEPVEMKGMRLAIVNTGEPERTTGELVSAVRSLDEAYRNPRMDELERLAHRMRDSLASGSAENTGRIFDKAQDLLAELGVSTEKIDDLVSDVKRAGGHAKLSGAGGGGIVLCMHKDAGKIMEIAGENGYMFWETGLGAEGVKIETE